jgi:hypothetical protein
MIAPSPQGEKIIGQVRGAWGIYTTGTAMRDLCTVLQKERKGMHDFDPGKGSTIGYHVRGEGNTVASGEYNTKIKCLTSQAVVVS